MYKSRLQEFCQSKSWNLPEYSTTKEGFDHCPKFKASVLVNGSTFFTPDFCKSSKEAQNCVAKLAFDIVTGSSTGSPSPLVPGSSSTLNQLEPGAALPATPMSIANSANNVIDEKLKGNIPGPLVSITSSTREQPELSERVQATPMSIDKKVKDLSHLYKNQLQIYAQKRNLNLPIYISERDGPPHAARFKCKVMIEGTTYECEDYHSTLKNAENAAAKVALMSVSSVGIEQEDAGVFKNLLQELAQKEFSCLPEYNTTSSGPSHAPVFISTVEIKDESFIGEAAKTKKLAEMYAAKVAYSTLKRREDQRVLESKHVVLHPETNQNIGQNTFGQKAEELPFSRSPSHSPARAFQPPSSPSIILINKPWANAQTSSAQTIRIIPREENMDLPPGATIQYEDDKWVAVAMTADSVQGNV